MVNKKPKVIIRADGNSEIGYGHIFRCLALAQVLGQDFECWFYSQNPTTFLKREIEKVAHGLKDLPIETNPEKEAQQLTQQELKGDEIVVLDGYHFDLAYQKVIKANGNSLVCIDDLADKHFVADLIINHAGGIKPQDYSVESHTKLCLGPQYALIRKKFFKEKKRCLNIDDGINILIYLNAYHHGDSLKTIGQYLEYKESVKNIHVIPKLEMEVFSQNFQNKLFEHYRLDSNGLIELFGQCDLIICPASTIAYEASAFGIGMMYGYNIENQGYIYKGLKKNNLGSDLGYLPNLNEKKFDDEFGQLDNKSLNNMVNNQSEIFNKDSLNRIIQEFNCLR
jgi:UDP-2,4-diacetamido-2,4,6-trideoxy-beta-L-altropyranose hydrolase